MLRVTLTVMMFLAGCDARSSAETAIVFVVLFGTLGRLFIDPARADGQ